MNLLQIIKVNRPGCDQLQGSVRTHFRNKKFVLNVMFQRRASKFAIFYAKEIPSCSSICHCTMEHFIEAKPLISEECGARVQAPWKVSPPDEKS